ncbi:MAG TPA: class I SAM-dependent methyltransferase [Anaerolineales bacterium]|nr:class I SAM-dependent methyltransferase [Anaerolineales bacterium]
MSLSLTLARYYHAHHSQQSEDIPFWLELAEQKGSPILELGCGSGRVSLALARAGHSVFGLDKDTGMLAVFKAQLNPELSSRIDILRADLTRFYLKRKFPLIIIPCNTYSTLSLTERLSSLSCVASHLQPGGCFAASLPNPTALAALPRRGDPELETTFPHPQDGEPVQVSSGWRRSGQQIIFNWHYDHLLPDGRVERQSLQIRQNLTPVEAYLEELQQAGLRIVEMYGDYNRTGYTPDSPYLILWVTNSQR